MTTLADRFQNALQEVLQSIDAPSVLTPDVAVEMGRMVFEVAKADPAGDDEGYPAGSLVQTTPSMHPVMEPLLTGCHDIPPSNEYYFQYHYRCLCCGAETIQGFSGRILHHHQEMALVGLYRSYVGEYLYPDGEEEPEPVFRLRDLRRAQLLAEAAA